MNRAITRLVCIAVMMLPALLSIALPLSDAGDSRQGAANNRLPRKEIDSVRVAQVSSKEGRLTKRNRAARNEPASNGGANRKAGATQAKSAGVSPKSKRAAPVTPEMETAVSEFVGQHHRELLDLLDHLKDRVPNEYVRAMRELNRTRLRLQQLEGRDRYAAELELWKAQSRARLLGARVQMGDDDLLRDTLRETLAEIYDLRADIVKRDRDRAAERLQRLDSQLQALRDDRDANLEKQLQALTKTAKKKNRSKPAKASAKKPTQNKKNSDTKNQNNSSNKPTD